MPLRSTISPRGAWTRTVRNEFAAACLTYVVPERICSAQSRRTRPAKITSIATPSTLTRRSSRESGRYGSSTLLLGGMNRFERGRSPAVVLAKQLHLGGVVGALARAQEHAHERIRRRGEDEVHDDRRQQAAHLRTGRRALTEHERDEQDPERVQEGDHCDREDRRVAAVAPCRLAVAADPIAGHGEHERGEPELAERR